MNKPKCALVLDDLQLKIPLGVTAKERSKKQTVLVTIEIDFLQPPRACMTGEISDTICYDSLIQEIKKFCRGKEFTLIESLGMQLYQLIKKAISKKNKLYLSIAKQYPLKELPQSIFEISD